MPDAQKQSLVTTKPILLFFVNSKYGTHATGNTVAEFDRSVIDAPADELNQIKKVFIFCKTSYLDDAKRYNIESTPYFLILDPFLKVLGTSSGSNFTTLQRAAKTVDSVYKNEEPNWSNLDIETLIEKPSKVTTRLPHTDVIIMAFFEQNGKSSKLTNDLLSHRILTAIRSRITFIKCQFSKNSEESKKWKITNEGSFLVIRPTGTNADGYEIVKKCSNDTKLTDLYTLIDKSINQIDKEVKRIK